MISRFQAEIATALMTAGLGLTAVAGALEFGIGWGDAGPEPGAFPFYIGLLVIAASIGTLVQAATGQAGAAIRLLGPGAGQAGGGVLRSHSCLRASSLLFLGSMWRRLFI